MVAQRPYQVVILGATGFTGRLGVHYLKDRYGSSVKWLATGRSLDKLQALAKELTLDSSQLAQCDVTDADSLDFMVQQATTVINFAGTPFVDKAIPVVAACARHGTSYVDITGEVPLQRATYDRYHEDAKKSGALIVHQCGYDSIPSDLGAFLAANELRTRFGCGTKELKFFAGALKGGISGGTLASALMLMTSRTGDVPGAEAAKSRGAYALDPPEAPCGPDRSDGGDQLVAFDERVGTWHMPFVMASANAPVVRKSDALLGYGGASTARPSYAEVMAVSSRGAALIGTAALAVVLGALLLPPLRWLLFCLRVLPRPGEGPTEASREAGYFHTYTLGVGDVSAAIPPRVVAHVRSGTAGDPGYKATAQMAIEAGMCSALEREKCATEGGVLTPASAFGATLVERLRRSGMELYVEVHDSGRP